MNFLNNILVVLCQRLAPLYPEHEVQMQHAWWILEYATGMSRLQLLCADTIKQDNLPAKLDHIITQHVTHHKPLAYIIGFVPFCVATILVEPPLLIPRMETEEWVENLINNLRQLAEKKLTEPLSILDLCSGSGCIAIALAHAFPTAHIVALDIEPRSIELIKKNMQHNNVFNVTAIQSNLFEALHPKSQFDIIVSNPPYITAQEYQQLDQSVKDWEDPKALFTDDEGLAVIKKIVAQAPQYIRSNSVLQEHGIAQLIIEIGHTQANVVKTMMTIAGYNHVQVHQDFAEKDRTVMGRIDNERKAQTEHNVRCGPL